MNVSFNITTKKNYSKLVTALTLLVLMSRGHVGRVIVKRTSQISNKKIR